MKKAGYVYIITNKRNTTVYTGVTSQLFTRILKHRTGFYKNSFSKRYNLNKLVYYKYFDDIGEAIKREKYIKGKTRSWKNELINSVNPEWRDLFPEIDPTFDLWK